MSNHSPGHKPHAPLQKLCGVWKKKRAKDGKTYLTGRLGYGRLLVLPNDKAGEPNEPDFICFLAPVEEKPKAKPTPQAQAEDEL